MIYENYSLDFLLLDEASGFKEQYKKCRLGPFTVPAAAATATRPPTGVASTAPPRMPNENILSNTNSEV